MNKNYKVINPKNEVIMVKGLKKFIVENKLAKDFIFKHINKGKILPTKHISGVSQERLNTTGWSFERLPD